MRPFETQPQWPDGNTPDGITVNRGGFVGGAGVAHAAPSRMRHARLTDGRWNWHGTEGAEPETARSQNRG